MALAADTKPTNAATNAELWVTDTDDIYRYNGTSWVLLVANDKTETLTNKTLGAVTMADPSDIALGSTTGTKIGTATTQKLGFYNKTPIAQKAAIPDTSSGVVATVETELNKVKQLLRDYGLLA